MFDEKCRFLWILYIVDNSKFMWIVWITKKGRKIRKNILKSPVRFCYISRLTVTIFVYVAGKIPIPFALLIAFTICPFPI